MASPPKSLAEELGLLDPDLPVAERAPVESVPDASQSHFSLAAELGLELPATRQVPVVWTSLPQQQGSRASALRTVLPFYDCTEAFSPPPMSPPCPPPATPPTPLPVASSPPTLSKPRARRGAADSTPRSILQALELSKTLTASTPVARFAAAGTPQSPRAAAAVDRPITQPLFGMTPAMCKPPPRAATSLDASLLWTDGAPDFRPASHRAEPPSSARKRGINADLDDLVQDAVRQAKRFQDYLQKSVE